MRTASHSPPPPVTSAAAFFETPAGSHHDRPASPVSSSRGRRHDMKRFLQTVARFSSTKKNLYFRPSIFLHLFYARTESRATAVTMTIILFLVDSSASMGQKTYLGTTYLDAARSTIELFWKLRQKDPVSKGDRYMLMTFDDFPKNVRSGWREGQATLSEQLKNLQPHGVTAFGPALGSAFRFVNLNRAQSGIENYGFGRHPYYVEPVVIVAFTDGGSLSTLREGTTGEIKFMRPEIPGTEMTEEPFRWDQRLYTVVLRYSGHPLKQKIPANAAVPSDRSHIDVMCQATGGRSYCVLSHKMIQQVVEDILKRVQLGGVLARFEKTGTDPPRVVIENENGAQVTIGIPQNEAWKNQLLNICKPVRIGPSSYVGHWPIPEAFWPDSTMAQFPPRKAHPVIQFKCDPCPQQLNNDFPFDKYELEPSALTQMILERRQVNVCWQVFVQNSATTPGIGHPFGYIKPSSNMQTVNLFIMPYNYPVILSILDEFKEARGRASGAIRSKLERYLTSVPFYYYGPLKKALKRINLTHQLLEEPGQVYPYSTVGYLNKIKATAKEEQEQLVVQVGENVQQSTAANLAVNVQVPILRTIQPPPAPTDDRRRSVIPSPPLPKDIFANFKITLSESKMRTATYNDPSSYFKNPFDVNRGSLIGQLTKMKMNFEQRLSDSTIPVLEGGMPGTRIKLQQAESLHSQTISTMGDYNAYMNRLKAIGGTRKLAEDKMARFHAFGNPFKEKKGMAIDEVGSLNETNAPGSSSPNKSVDKSRPRRKSGPLQFETGSAWRKRLRSISMSGSDTSSVFSDFSDVASISSLENDVIVDEAECSTGLVIAEEEQMEVSNGNENGSATAHAPTTNGRPKDVHKPAQNGTASRKRKLDLPNNVKLPEATTAAVNNKLTTEQLRRRKLAICSIARTLSQRPEQICQRVVEAIGDVGVEDQLKIVKQAMHQAEKLKREKLLCCLEKEHQRLRDKREASKSPLSPTSTTGVH
ncbi:hypothetical protein L596_020496 [Steinernema carpocapsae]|uniref:VWFA domain-containing protein n=1 Tax=Steinernema carpocapsae TaxID=34508 RepID=A0A4U5MTX1_STECR|nr:hypothetical protein L596_020496 [Steinernema carpocapsae]